MTHDDLIPLFHNVIAVEKTPEGLIGRRYAPAQRQYCDGLRYAAMMGDKARMTAGVTLEMDTDADRLLIEWSVGNGYPWEDAERRSTADIYVNGTLHTVIPIEPPLYAPQSASIALPKGGKRVVIFLPHLHEFCLRGLTVPPGAALAPVPKRPHTLLMIGDSITQGIGALRASEGYAMQAALRLPEFEAINQSVGAIRYEADTLAPLPNTPDLITVLLGTNSWSKDNTARFDESAQAFYSRLRALFPDTPTLILSPLKRMKGEGDRPSPDIFPESDLYARIARLCAPYPEMTVIDGWTLLDHDPDLFLDGLHPNASGMQQVSERLIRVIRETTGLLP
ncbi:MAG: SGNH/GDSL hydrolase family protein [Clostridia bacterium]|nr:SGNH/GDSL hydrolase family protein [Clostridia bacterium]